MAIKHSKQIYNKGVNDGDITNINLCINYFNRVKQGLKQRRMIMKSVMISIQPKWCTLISLGEKYIEIRKTKPKIEAPFNCYIYCTSIKNIFGLEYRTLDAATDGKIFDWHKKVIGEFTCDGIYEFEAEISKRANAYEAITLRRESEDYDEYGDYRYSLVSENGDNANWFMHQSCVMWNDLKKYLGYKSREFYGWRIRNLEIYKNPKRLSEFGLTRPPQDWCYVKELTK